MIFTKNSVPSEYEVQEIKDIQLEDDGDMFVFIKWRNWSSKTNTWEPLSNIKCYEKIIRFLEKWSYDESFITTLMSHYVRNNLYSPLMNVRIMSRLLGNDLSIDDCVRLESWEKSGVREALRELDPKTLRRNILKRQVSYHLNEDRELSAIVLKL